MTEDEVKPAAGGSLPELETELCALAGQIAAATSRFLRLLAEFDQRRGWEGVNIRSCAHWLSWRCGLSIRTAHEQVRVARALTKLPLIQEAFDAGRVSYSKVRAIARVATPTSEPDLLSAALHAPAAHVERLVRGLRTAQRYAKDMPGDEADVPGLTPLPDPRDRHRLHWRWAWDGDLVITGRLAPEDGARLLAAITKAQTEPDPETQLYKQPAPQPEPPAEPQAERESGVKPVAEEKAHPEAETPTEAETEAGKETATKVLRASWMRAPSDLTNGLVTMAEMICAGLPAPIHAPAAEVHVTVDIDTLTKAFATDPTAEPTPDPTPDAEPDPLTGARLEDGPALDATTLRRLADDARITLTVLDADGRTLHTGRTHRTPSTGQLRALWRRDHGCTVPGCDHDRFLHAHHVVYWSRGGKTELDNLLLLCSRHHRELHEGRFSIRALGAQRFEFTGPRGTLHPAPPTHGSADDLQKTFDTVEPEACVPDWDGTPLYGWAISSYLTAWRVALRHPGRSRR